MLKREFFDAPFYTIFILILIISANFLGSTFPCRVQKLLSENVYIKHIDEQIINPTKELFK